jgi:hypothetical protein
MSTRMDTAVSTSTRYLPSVRSAERLADAWGAILRVSP